MAIKNNINNQNISINRDLSNIDQLLAQTVLKSLEKEKLLQINKNILLPKNNHLFHAFFCYISSLFQPSVLSTKK